ncbi:MAG: cupin domain-containing protein [Lachnospiraceae bacterium]|nr:cupin domain-containing protein [Lachnospiraceae bacterium]
MYIVLLSGGSGKRLWPLSNDLRSKQYIKLVNDEEDTKEKCSMIQRVWKQLEKSGLASHSIITASKGQVEIIKSQLGNVDIAVEPNRRDTFPAVAISCAYIKSVMGAKKDDVVAVLPVDPYTEDAYFETVKHLEKILTVSDAEIALMGAEPTYPSEKYGYIIPGKQGKEYIEVKGFVEKPDKERAKKLLDEHAIWNCGVFCFRLGLMEEKAEAYGLKLDYHEMFNHYDKLPKISFDYEVLEKSEHLVAASFKGLWKDLGTWNTLTEEMGSDSIGNTIMDKQCENTQVINELDIPVVTMGTKNMVVVAAYDGILVADKNQSSYIKDVTAELHMAPMYEERRWGTLKSIDRNSKDGEFTLTRKIKIFKGKSSSYHYHEHRIEIFTALSGEAEMILEGVKITLTQGSAICIQANQKHAIQAITEFEYLETQVGAAVGNDDITRITFNWDEIPVAVLN